MARIRVSGLLSGAVFFRLRVSVETFEEESGLSKAIWAFKRAFGAVFEDVD